ncbi:hypothetical protein A8B78_02290 [Jannaschia sp. EhC01]|nr:hypothetical protein A8B78_02290 [Jannaschia sp. EhC01]
MIPKRSTIKDVADRARVSTATVSNVVNGTKPVNAKLRKRVEKAARELSYQVDRAASQLRSRQTRIIGVLVPDLDDTFFTSLVSRFEIMAGESGYDVIVASSRDDLELEVSRLNAMLGWRPSGLVVVPCSDAIPQIVLDECHRLPVVLADRVATGAQPADAVLIDNFEAGQIAARHLVAMGHSQLVVAASRLGVSPISERVRGVEEYLQEALGISPIVIEVGSNAMDAADVLERWLERNSHPTAILGLTNVTTLGALTALAARRIEVPDQISILGFDDYAWMSARKTALTAIRQPVDELARVVWERLTARMAGDASPPQRLELKTSLQVRSSVRDISKSSDQPAPDTPLDFSTQVKPRPKPIH